MTWTCEGNGPTFSYKHGVQETQALVQRTRISQYSEQIRNYSGELTVDGDVQRAHLLLLINTKILSMYKTDLDN